MDRNASLTAEEKAAIRDLTVKGLKSYHFFMAVRIDNRVFPVQTINDFSAELKDNQLIYDFFWSLVGWRLYRACTRRCNWPSTTTPFTPISSAPLKLSP
jgi:hypothetical protein